jgi:lipid-binding SYLF domain-containing protein
MKKLFGLLPAIVLVFSFCISPGVEAGGEEWAKLDEATAVLWEIKSIPEQGIPPALLSSAHGVAVIPGLIKAGFIVGGRYGQGVMVVRSANGRWSNPTFITLTGGSVGWQIGAQSTDIVLVFKSSRSVDAMASGKFTLGADLSVAAGPVGRHAEAGTDSQLRAEILSYSRSRGLFAGVALEGAALQIDNSANAYFYGKQYITPWDIFDGRGIDPPPPVGKFIGVLEN